MSGPTSAYPRERIVEALLITGWDAKEAARYLGCHFGTVHKRIKDLKLKRPAHFPKGNVQRSKTHCPRGHEYAGDNLFVDANGGRRCRTCDRAKKRIRPKKKLVRSTLRAPAHVMQAILYAIATGRSPSVQPLARGRVVP